MAKATHYYHGSDSYGRQIEVAKSVNGFWFHREYVNNAKYGYHWSKWVCDANGMKHPDKIRNNLANDYADVPEYVEIPENERENYVTWGFKTLRGGPRDGLRLRLPF